MGIPVVEGRTFELADVAGTPVVLINEALVAKFFPDRDPIGAHLKPGSTSARPYCRGSRSSASSKTSSRAASTRRPAPSCTCLVEQQAKAGGFAPGQMNIADSCEDAAGHARAVVQAFSRRARSDAAADAHAVDGRRDWRRDRAAAVPDDAARHLRGTRARCWPRSAPTASCRTSSPNGDRRSASAWRSARIAASILQLVLARGLLLSGVGLRARSGRLGRRSRASWRRCCST